MATESRLVKSLAFTPCLNPAGMLIVFGANVPILAISQGQTACRRQRDRACSRMGVYFVDLNQVLFDHQVALIRADDARKSGRKPNRGEVAALYDRVRSLRSRLGVWHQQRDFGAGL